MGSQNRAISTPQAVDFVIIGAGPAGLAAAIALKQAGFSHLVVDKGTIVNSIYHFPEEMVFFTDRALLEIGGIPFAVPEIKPNRIQALHYYRGVVRAHRLRVLTDTPVVGIEGEEGNFLVHTESPAHPTIPCRRVVVAVGYYDNPNLLGVPGEDLPHVSHYYDSPHPYYGKRVVIVGGQNSAVEAALELYRNGAEVTLVHRRSELGQSLKYWIRPDIENRIKEGAITAHFNTEVRAIDPGRVHLVNNQTAKSFTLPADRVLLLTGYHPDASLLRELGIEVDPESLVPAHDPESLESNRPGVFLAGAVLSGRNTNQIFIENGRFHGEQIVRALLRRRQREASG